ITGLVEIDELLQKVNLLPPYVSQLELTREEKSLPRNRRREALEEKCDKGFTVNASKLIDIMGAIIRYPRAHYFELACVLSFVSGRGLLELVGTAVQYLPSSHVTYEPEVRFGELMEHTVIRVPLLCEYEHFINGVKRLRGMKDASHLTPAEVNHRYSKSANLSARKLLLNGVAGCVFSDFKTVHVAITHKVF
ncbi:unnamed protein product, partial [Laminaria digitata]